MDRIMKIMAVATAFSGVAVKVVTWIINSKDPMGDGGEEITSREIAHLDHIFTEALNQSLAQAGQPYRAEIYLYSLEAIPPGIPDEPVIPFEEGLPPRTPGVRFRRYNEGTIPEPR